MSRPNKQVTAQACEMHFNWSPGIGDPTIGGWVTVALYLLTSFSCWRSAGLVRMQHARMLRESRAWRSISCLFLALGINKQLDLQSALTEVGRILAQAQGWYAQREVVQLDFILLVAVACLIAAIVLVILVRRSPLSTWLALIGTAMVLCFVFIRAASFHHFDRFIGSRVFGLRWNWIVEMSGISLVLLASQWRQVRLTRVS
jgi:hypothetical protein